MLLDENIKILFNEEGWMNVDRSHLQSNKCLKVLHYTETYTFLDTTSRDDDLNVLLY